MPPLNPIERKRLALVLGQVLSFTPAAEAADLTVTSAADDGTACTLREAIVSINAGSDQSNGCGGSGFGSNDSIGFANSLSGQTITLTGGALSITGNVAINGPGQSQLVISGNNSSGIFHTSRATVSFNDLTISGGNTSRGGGIHVYESNVTLKNSTVSGNSASLNGGGIFVVAVYGDSTVTLSNSTVSGNSATRGGGIRSSAIDGVSYNPVYATVSLSNSTVSGNSAQRGGGIYTDTEIRLDNSTVSGNSASIGGGILARNASQVVTLNNSAVSDNLASADGGGIYLYDASVTLSNSTVSGNTATLDGGGIHAGYDFYMYYGANHVTLNNSTVSGNVALRDGGGIYTDAKSFTTLKNSTVAGNSATRNAGGIFVGAFSTATLTNTILANGSNTDCHRDATNGAVINSGGNLVENDSNCGTFTIEGQDPKLGLLKDNGGATLTHELLSGSPAINVGMNGASCLATDQRGAPRSDGMCDIGAYEFGAVPPGALCGLPAGTNHVMLRDAMSEWLGKCVHGASHTPPTYSGVYTDVTNSDYNADWIQQVYDDSTTKGCDDTNTAYCPKDPVAKTSAVKLILRAKYPWDIPPIATMEPFLDVPFGHPDINWIAKAKEDGVTHGCGDGTNFCANEILTSEAFHKMLDAVFD